MTSYLRRWSSQAIYLAINWPYLADPTAVYVNTTSLEIDSQCFEYDQAQKQNNKNNPPTTIDQNGYCW